MREMRLGKWGAWAAALSTTTAVGCAAVLGIDEDYHPLGEGGAGGTGDSSSGGSGGSDGSGESGGASGTGTYACSAGTCAMSSCVGLSSTCGLDRNESCCTSLEVPGGTYNRSNNAMYPATVSDFRLDRFEITVGRFRAFVAAYPGSKPKVGDGAHPLIAGSGWDQAWEGNLPADRPAFMAALLGAVGCDLNYRTWTDTPGANENLPMNCITWFEAFAFCAWDGGRLPTEAEWNYAAAGGNEQRQYPWGSAPPDVAHAVHDCTGDGSGEGDCAFTDILTVGSKPTGDGKWGQADLAGSMWEWNLDWRDNYSASCDNCANMKDTSYRVRRGGSWVHKPSYLLSDVRIGNTPPDRNYYVGARCARTP